jgi:hypothetical protein
MISKRNSSGTKSDSDTHTDTINTKITDKSITDKSHIMLNDKSHIMLNEKNLNEIVFSMILQLRFKSEYANEFVKVLENYLLTNNMEKLDDFVNSEKTLTDSNFLNDEYTKIGGGTFGIIYKNNHMCFKMPVYYKNNNHKFNFINNGDKISIELKKLFYIEAINTCILYITFNNCFKNNFNNHNPFLKPNKLFTSYYNDDFDNKVPVLSIECLNMNLSECRK